MRDLVLAAYHGGPVDCALCSGKAHACVYNRATGQGVELCRPCMRFLNLHERLDVEAVV
jgi:hypothetical protein